MSESGNVFDVNPQSFQSDVIERSRQVPVLLLFWAEQVPPSADMRTVLTQLVGQYAGKVALGLVDVAVDPTLAQHLRVQGLPSIRIVRDGQLVEQLDGPQPEHVLRALLDQLTLSPAEMVKGQLEEILARNDFATARRLLEQVLQEEPNNPAFQVELADVLVRQGELDAARALIERIPEDTPERERPVTRLALAEEAAGLPDESSLRARIDADPDDLEARHQLAVVLAARGAFQEALDEAMVILQKDRSFGDDVGRKTMIRIFNVLGKGSELAGQYRRRMFNFLH